MERVESPQRAPRSLAGCVCPLWHPGGGRRVGPAQRLGSGPPDRPRRVCRRRTGLSVRRGAGPGRVPAAPRAVRRRARHRGLRPLRRLPRVPPRLVRPVGVQGVCLGGRFPARLAAAVAVNGAPVAPAVSEFRTARRERRRLRWAPRTGARGPGQGRPVLRPGQAPHCPPPVLLHGGLVHSPATSSRDPCPARPTRPPRPAASGTAGNTPSTATRANPTRTLQTGLCVNY